MGPTCIFKYSSRCGLNFHNDDFFTLFCDLYVVQLKESYLAHFLCVSRVNFSLCSNFIFIQLVMAVTVYDNEKLQIKPKT